MKKTKYLLLSTILCPLLFISAIKAQTNNNSEKQGAYNMPYVRYDSKDAKVGGKAKRLKADDFDYRKTAAEACNQEYIALKTTKDYISWQVKENANGVTIRFTLPDNEKGESVGQKSGIDIYVNNKYVKTITLDSRWAWQYFKQNESNPLLDITDMPLMRFDETHFLLTKPLIPGDLISIRKTNNDNLDCGIDFIEIENVPDLIPQPKGVLSVKEFGAKGNGKVNDLPAFNACIKEALKQNKTVYIPEGTYALDSLFTLFEDNIKIQGAGMWYTNLFFTNNGIMKGGICGNASNLRISDLYINGVNTLRQERNGDYRDYKAIWGNFGENSVIENVWEEHFECGIWIAGYYAPIKEPTQGLRVSNVRLRNNYADGVNFAEGTSNSIFEYSDVRNCGDDGIASWSQTHKTKQCNTHNIFRYSTVEFGWRAGGIGMFGGSGHEIYNCYVGEMLMSAGIRFTSDFPGCALDTENPMKVSNCTVYKCGTTKDLFSNRLGAIDIHGSDRYNLDNIQFNNISIIKSQSDGIQLWGGHLENVSFKNTLIEEVGKGYKLSKKKQKSYAIATHDKGSTNFSSTIFKKCCFNKINKNNQFVVSFTSSCQTKTFTKARSEIINVSPSWIMQGNIYEVNIRQYTKEGTINAFAKHLDRLKEMGVQTLWFMPMNPISKVDRKGSLGSYYAVSDYTALNPEFGTITDFKQVVKSIHKKGMKVIIDWVPNHTGADNRWLTEHPDFFVKDSTGKAAIAVDWNDTRQLNYKNPVMQDSMIAAMKYWVSTTDIDGFRCDVAWNVPAAFWRKCIPQLKNMKSIFMLAEGDNAYLPESGFDAVYPWPMFKKMINVAKGEKTALSLDSIWRENNNMYPGNTIQMYFTSNHDENSWNNSDFGTFPGAVHAPFAVFSQTMANSVPLIYSGQEEPVLRALKFFDRDPMTFDKFQRAVFYKTLLNLRKRNAALSADASFRKVSVGDDKAIYAFVREKGKKKVFVILNFSDKTEPITIKEEALFGKAYNVFKGAKEDLSSKRWNMQPWGYVVYEYNN